MLVSVSRTLAQRLKTCEIKLVFRWRLHDSIHIATSAGIPMQPSSTAASASAVSGAAHGSYCR